MKVFMIQDKNTLLLHGCFSTEEKANKYIDFNFDNFKVIKKKVA